MIMLYILPLIVAFVPGLWIEDYNLTNPIWWTVMATWFFGDLRGTIRTAIRMR